MNRIPGHLARRMDRLAGRAHLFHRYAHHPLCVAYRGEVLRFGRLRVCRGCTFAILGGIAGLLMGWFLPAFSLRAQVLLSGVTLSWALAVFMWVRLRSLGKVATRVLPPLLATFLLTQGIRDRSVWGSILVGGVSVVIFILVRIYRRRGPWRGPCATCLELEARPCSGFLPQMRREKAFRRAAGRLLDREGVIAKHKVSPVN